MSRTLNKLTSEDFEWTVGLLPSPSAVRNYLSRSKEVDELRKSIKTGEVTEADLRRFVGHLMDKFQTGQRFPHEAAISAVCVAIEPRETGFAEEYTNDLAALELNEMSTAIRVARISAKARSRLAKNERSSVWISVLLPRRVRGAAGPLVTAETHEKRILCS